MQGCATLLCWTGRNVLALVVTLLNCSSSSNGCSNGSSGSSNGSSRSSSSAAIITYRRDAVDQVLQLVAPFLPTLSLAGETPVWQGNAAYRALDRLLPGVCLLLI